jgi:hypothetical protein
VKTPGYADIAFPSLNASDNARSLLRGQSARDFRQTSSTANPTNGFFAGVKFSGDIHLAHAAPNRCEDSPFRFGGKFVTALHSVHVLAGFARADRHLYPVRDVSAILLPLFRAHLVLELSRYAFRKVGHDFG